MKKELNKKSNQVTVLLQGSYTVDSDELKKFIREEHCPLFYSLDDSGIIRFEWFLDENEKTGTLIEIFEDSNTSINVPVFSFSSRNHSNLTIPESSKL